MVDGNLCIFDNLANEVFALYYSLAKEPVVILLFIRTLNILVHNPFNLILFLIAGKILQAVSLIASYLQVPLRYPLRFGCSRSYIRDYAPSIEPASSDSVSDSLASTSGKPIEFPLFLEGQDSTRAAYAVFLLNKVTHIM